MTISNIKNTLPLIINKINVSIFSLVDSLAEAIVGLTLSIDDNYEIDNQLLSTKLIDNLIGEQSQKIPDNLGD